MRFTQLCHLAFILFHLVSCDLSCNSQELNVSKNFKERLKTTDIIVLGEVHTKKNANHKIKLVKFLSQETGNKFVAIEAPRITQVYANQYILNGDRKAKKLFSKSIYIRYRKDYVTFLDSIKAFNAKLHDSSKVIVKCFDLQSQSGILSFDDVEDFINYLDNPLLNDLKKIISSSELSVKDRQDRLYKNILKNENTYKNVMSISTYYSLLDYVKGIEIINSYGKVKLSNIELAKKREQFISENITNLFVRNKMKSLAVFIGDYHISKLENDDWTEYNTLAYKLSKTHDVLSIFTLYSEDSTFPYNIFNYDYTEILEVEYDKLSRKYNSDELILFCEDDEPQEGVFWKRYDGILLKFK